MIEIALALSLLAASPAEIKAADAALYCMAENIYHEARGESKSGQYAVANVVVNRIASEKYPDTICGVTKQTYWVIRGGKRIRPQKYRCQFSWFCDGRSDEIRDIKSWRNAYKIAVDVVYRSPKDLTYGATHYHADYVNPQWAKYLKRTVKIGTHIFYR